MVKVCCALVFRRYPLFAVVMWDETTFGLQTG